MGPVTAARRIITGRAERAQEGLRTPISDADLARFSEAADDHFYGAWKGGGKGSGGRPEAASTAAKPERLRGSYAPPGGATYRETVTEWTEDSSAARAIRQGMLTDNPPPMSVTMLDALANHSQPAPALYRGLSVESLDAAQARFGSEFDLGASSFSSRRTNALDFTALYQGHYVGSADRPNAPGTQPVLLKVAGARAFNISRLADPFEHEWVAMGRFRPLGSRFIDDPVYGRVLEVRAEQIASIG